MALCLHCSDVSDRSLCCGSVEAEKCEEGGMCLLWSFMRREGSAQCEPPSRLCSEIWFVAEPSEDNQSKANVEAQCKLNMILQIFKSFNGPLM